MIMMAATLRVFLACSALLFAACSLPVVSGQSTVYLSLNGVIISNNSYILTSDVGIFDSALQCNTDRSDCCRASDHPNGVAQGQWYYPDGREVRSFTEEDAGPPRNFFYRNRDDGIVRLSRYGNPPEANRGRFRCEIPDANGVNVNIFVNIVDMLPPTTTQSPATTTLPDTTTEAITIPDTTSQLYVADTTTQAAISTALGTTDSPTTIPDTTTQGQITTQAPTTTQTATTQDTMTQETMTPATSTKLMATTDQATTTPSDVTTPTIIQATQVQVSFQSNNDSKDISFSLTCNSTGGQVNSVVWTRDGFLLHNTGLLVVTDASTLSYTNVLMVSGRAPGTYTCTMRGTSDQVLSSASIDVQASSPPLNVQATQSSSSALVEVSWSPPTDGANIITGYRIYFSNGKSLLVYSYYVTSIIILDNPPDVGETVSIHSESTQLPSELVNVTVMIEGDRVSPAAVLCTCSSEVGISVGVVLLMEGFIALVTVITVVLLWRRRKKSANVDMTVIANMAYGQVKLGTDRATAGGGDLAEYEDPEKLARFGEEQGRYELSGQWQYESIPAIRLHPVST